MSRTQATRKLWPALFAAVLWPWLLHAASPVSSTRVCVSCHRAEATTQPGTSMAHALETVSDCEILRSHPRLAFQERQYSYEIRRDGNRSLYTVADGKHSMTVPIEWAVGLGDAGQTYVYRWKGNWYESHVSFFKTLQGLDRTIGPAGEPKDLLEAAGRLLTMTETKQCFNCHGTRAVQDDKLDLEALIPGVQCERCHGPAEQHVKALKNGDAKAAAMRKLGDLTTDEISNLCGDCHRAFAQIAMSKIRGIDNVRFQPYRLTNSKCYNPLDPRIGCPACHDPHREVSREAAVYDAKCAACHVPLTGSAPSRATAESAAHPPPCPVATKDCVTCHMPKYEIRGSHNQFTDHWIRVVKPGEPYPG
jgi:cytochrome c554/c'-like protein